jgi:hypothetical protein
MTKTSNDFVDKTIMGDGKRWLVRIFERHSLLAELRMEDYHIFI